MAPSRGRRGGQPAAASATASSARRRSGRNTKHEPQNPYSDMLAEAAVTDPVEDTDRPLKRRRIVREVSLPGHYSPRQTKPEKGAGGGNTPAQAINTAAPIGLQTIEASSDSGEEDEEDDFAFEDVDLDGPSTRKDEQQYGDESFGDVSIQLDQQPLPKRKSTPRRKPATAAEKDHRLLVHKAHVLCLLGHCIYVNSWCNDETVHGNVEGLLNAKTTSLLNPKTSDSQFVRNRAFMAGLEQAAEVFKERFNVNSSGMRKARWAEDGDEATDQVDVEPMDRSDFIRASKRLKGSQDIGNQLFCALLRAAGVDARIVCSLQPLPFASSTAKPSNTPQKKPPKSVVLAIASDTDPDKPSASEASDNSIATSRTIGKIPSARRRLGQPSFNTSPASTAAPRATEKKPPVRRLAYPVFWVEAFNEAHQKWIPLDPIVTGTIAKPSKLEPPAAYEFNQLSYAIAFEPDGAARDVTKRYAKAFNAKTRRSRVESSGEEGVRWWKKTMRFFQRRGLVLDRDQVEDAELTQKEAREGLPNNVQDFKDHPLYALERHTKRHEVIHPRREVGKVNAGTAAKPRMEAVFRRRDVLVCRSADKWYRLGRIVKEGEQPLKNVVSRRPVGGRRARSPSAEDEDGATKAVTALYAPFQTELYVPPPVVKGRVPRNAFGNLDIYLPSMVPAGGTHLRHALTKDAARFLRVDCVDAVTGFQFKGRQGTAVIEGGVVPSVYAPAVEAVIEGLEWEVELEVSRQRSAQALRLWKRFLTGLRIAERVRTYGDAGKGVVGSDAEGKDGNAGVAGEQSGGNLAAVVPDENSEEDGRELPTAGQYTIDELVALSTKTSSKKSFPRKKKRRVDDSDEEEILADDDSEGDAGDPLSQDPDAEYSGGDGGGFFPDDGGNADLVAQPTAGEGGGFFGNEDGDGEGSGGGGGFLVPDEEGEEVGGGGFLAGDDGASDGGFESENFQGGGFLPESNEQQYESVREGSKGEAIRNEGPNDLSEFPEQQHTTSNVPIPNADDPEPPIRPPITLPGSGETERQEDNSDKDPATPSTSLAAHQTAKPPHQNEGKPSAAENNAAEEKGEEVGGEESSSEDRGSLLSHDPEDEDAEPDWLESE
ncbi:Rad4-domain-containing protein [Hortaea werneckii]|nr:Rad4-domain-containing protein [Hortaea werneckii]KAI7306601.1 Rad4-domain-containing protein [Hortaea werneckii]